VPRFLRQVAIFYLLLFLAGCYSPPPTQTDISITLSGKSFQPASWRVPAGATITLRLANHDPDAHQLQILYRQAVVPYGPADEASIYWSHTISAGASETVQLTAPAAAGNYDVIGVDSLYEGMVARLTVVRLDSARR
jgi:plastocyanin